MNFKIGKETVLVIPDTHYPFDHPDTIRFLKALKDRYKPTKVVCIGDILDLYSLSRFPKSPRSLSPASELKLARKRLRPLYKLFPKVHCTIGNHDIRAKKLAESVGIPKECLKPFSWWAGAPKGWTFVESITYDQVLYTHGIGSGVCPALVRAEHQGMSVVNGHNHSALGVMYRVREGFTVFGASTGCLVDLHCEAMSYGVDHKDKPALGAIIINKGWPIIHPMLTNKHGKWIGEL